MPSSFSYKVQTEVRTGVENNIIPLTKRLNFFQKMLFVKEENIRIRKITLSYLPRTGTLGSGQIRAVVIDNRIDPDLDDRVINELSFDAGDKMNATWSSCIWLPKSDFVSKVDPPILFEMELSECNLTAGYSVGRMTIVVEITASEGMEKFTMSRPIARISANPFIPTTSHSARFDVKQIESSANRSLTRSVSYRALPEPTSKDRLIMKAHEANGDRLLSKPGIRSKKI
ncbi:MAG: movement protein [Pastinaca cytorhabdovirus 1]|uniref:Movement protein n=1 Tax=Pastinaca cytorhabdovirus 1 TaxID=2950847 RepID=A0AAE9MRI2_9RHAB|nr:MAG: movement protein [Pastinaca cytorhabdovirus 1]